MSERGPGSAAPPQAPSTGESSAGRKRRKRDPLLGKVLADRFRILSVVARGGMGKVYRAEQSPLGREVALKVLDVRGATEDDEFGKRFSLEASICARLTHPNTVRVFDYGVTWDDVYFIAMEFLEGRSLHDLLKSEGPLPPERVLHIMKQMCGSLSEAHEQGIIHRDLKPANVLLVQHGDDPDFVKVVDFGLVKQVGDDAQMTRAGMVMGSPMYMAPEQVQGDPVDPRTDIYALGVILYLALSGRTPFDKATTTALLMAHVNEAVPPLSEVADALDLSPAFEWVVLRCLEKDPADRFGSAAELLVALRAVEAELHGHIDDLVLDLDDGRVVLPPELVASLGAGSRAVSLDGTLRRSAVRPAERTGRRGLWIGVAAASLVALAVALGGVALAVAVGVVGFGGSETVEAPEASEPVAPAPAEVVIRTEPADAEIVRDGVFLGAAPVTVSVPDGERIALTVTAPGHEERTVRIDGSRDEMTIRLRPTPPAPETRAAPAPPKTAPARTPPRTPLAPTPAPTTPAPTAAPTTPAPTAAPEPAADDAWRSGSPDVRDPWEDG